MLPQMVQQLNQPKLELGGTPQEQELARQVWNMMRMQGFAYASDRPISQSLQNLADYLAGQKYNGLSTAEEVIPLIDQALSASPAVFYREEADDGAVFFKTTKRGKAAGPAGPLDQHSFQARLKADVREVEPSEEEESAQEATTPTHTVPAMQLPVAAQPTQPREAAIQPPPVVTQPPPREVVKPQIASVQPPAATPPPTKPVAKVVEPVEPAVVAPPPAPVETVAPVAPPPTPVVEAPAPPTSTAGPVTLPDGTEVDLRRPTAEIMREYGPEFAALVQKAVSEDFRFVNFANDWYIEDMTGRYSRGDFRRIREFMSEEQGPVSDTAVLREIYNKRTTDSDYEATRFALNFRLFKEKKDFEFVGANDDRVWTAPGVVAIGQPRRKAAEIGTDYKFLEDPSLVDQNELIVENGAKRWEHILTFYEYENGVLPYDETAKDFFPGPLFDDQKSLILRFEAVQAYVNYTAELRYPTGTRGGWIMGLEGFFSNNLVPGAVLVIQQGEKSNHFTVEYKQAEEQEARLLFYDERRQKFVFRPIVFECEVNRSLTLSSDRFGQLEGQRRMEENERKKTDQIVSNAFQFVGEKQGDAYYALLDDLYPIVNIERPFSRAYLRHLLSSGNSAFRPDETMPDAFYYKLPGRR